MATGIRDKVAIIGMGCSKFGERWDVGAEGLIVEAFQEAIADAGIEKKDIQAAWFGVCMEEVNVGKGSPTLGVTLRLPNIPISRMENYCATGTEAFRAAAYAVASGAYDICLAQGVEKLKDTGYGGLPAWGATGGTRRWQWFPNATAPGLFAQLASAYGAKFKVKNDDIKRAIAHVSMKSHANGALNPKAHLQKAVTVEQIMAARSSPGPWGCSTAAASPTDRPAPSSRPRKSPRSSGRRRRTSSPSRRCSWPSATATRAASTSGTASTSSRRLPAAPPPTRKQASRIRRRRSA